MLIHEHNRTEEFVDDLQKTSKRIYLSVLIVCCANFAFWGLAVGVSIAGESGAFVGAVIGLVLGWVAGSFGNMIVSAVIEWMAQMLIAQGEMVDLLKVRK
jgi:hypothetical protein